MSSNWTDSGGKHRELSAGIITVRKAGSSPEFLLLQHANGSHWSFPKGHVEGDEKSKEAATRELREETGLSVERFIGDFEEVVRYSYERDGETRHKKVIYFLGFVSSEIAVSLSSEHLDYSWLRYAEARKRLTYEDDAELLDRAISGLQKTGRG